jgi:hypothetical protein
MFLYQRDLFLLAVGLKGYLICGHDCANAEGFLRRMAPVPPVGQPEY